MALTQIVEFPLKKVAATCFRITAAGNNSGSLKIQQCCAHSLHKNIQTPDNMLEQDNAQKVKFSPQRSRDTTSSQISAKLGIAGSGAVFGRGILGTSNSSSSFNEVSTPTDSHVPVYDLLNSVSLSSVMQTNVPQPFKVEGSLDRSGHLGMPGGQWSQNDKYVSSDLVDNHKKVESSLKKGKNNLNSDAKLGSFQIPPLAE